MNGWDLGELMHQHIKKEENKRQRGISGTLLAPFRCAMHTGASGGERPGWSLLVARTLG